MFAVIETKGASHLVIDIPVETSSQSLPALTRMLENNCVLVKRGWREIEVVKDAAMTVVMGNTFTADQDGAVLEVRKAGAESIIGGEFVAASPEAFIDFSKARKKHDEETQRLRNEIAVLKDKVAFLEAQAEANQVE